jgi:hypothetical protein
VWWFTAPTGGFTKGWTYAVSVDVNFQSTPSEAVFAITTDDGQGGDAIEFALVRDHVGGWYLAKKYDRTEPAAPAYLTPVWDPKSFASQQNASGWGNGSILSDTIYTTFMPNGQIVLDEVVLFSSTRYYWAESLINSGYPVSDYQIGGITTPPTQLPSFDFSGQSSFRTSLTNLSVGGQALSNAWTRRHAAFTGGPLGSQGIASDQNLIARRLGSSAVFDPTWLPCNSGQFQVNGPNDTPPTLTTSYTPSRIFTACTTRPSPTISPVGGVDFGYKSGGESLTAQVTVTNPSALPLEVTGETLTGVHTSSYSIINDQCIGKVISPGQNCSFSVLFRPRETGNLPESILISSKNTGLPVSFSMTGFGRTYAPKLNHYDLNDDYPQWVAVTNTDPVLSLSMYQWDIQNRTYLGITYVGDYYFTANSGYSGACQLNVPLGPGASCTIRFDRTSGFCFWTTCHIAAREGFPVSINVTNGDPAVLTLHTNADPPAGLQIAAPSLSTNSLTFVPLDISGGATSPPQTITLTNSDPNYPLGVTSIVLAGNTPGDFTESDNCTANGIPVGGSCTISVVYAPQNPVTSSAVLQINNQSSSPVISVQLSGSSYGVPL